MVTCSLLPSNLPLMCKCSGCCGRGNKSTVLVVFDQHVFSSWTLWRSAALLSTVGVCNSVDVGSKLQRPPPPPTPPLRLMVIRFSVMLSCCRVSMGVGAKPCYCSNWKCSMCLEQKKRCFDKEINLPPVNPRLRVFSVKLQVPHWTVEGNKEQLVQLNLRDTPTFTAVW